MDGRLNEGKEGIRGECGDGPPAGTFAPSGISFLVVAAIVDVAVVMTGAGNEGRRVVPGDSGGDVAAGNGGGGELACGLEGRRRELRRRSFRRAGC